MEEFKWLENNLKTRESIRQLNNNWDDFVEAITAITKIKKAHYDACIKQGFSEQQALILTDLHFKNAEGK